jgi:glutathione S-transferase
MLTLFTTALSANGRKPLAVARHLGLEVDVHSVNVYRGEGQAPQYRALNPWGKIPTLVDDDFVLWESNAILTYLSEAHGDFVLSSREPRRRGDILRWMFWESAHFQPVLTRLMTPRVAQVLFPEQGADAKLVPWDDRELATTLGVLEARLEPSPFLVGDELSIADFSIAGMTTYFSVAGFPHARFPAISAWIERLEQLPAWASTAVAPWSPAG